MITKIISILMVLLGILGLSGLFLSIRIHDKNVINKYKTIKFFLDTIMYTFYIIAGLFLIFKVFF